jgi:hypothetical protein
MENQNCFLPAEILLPNAQVPMETWAVVACDQFSSQPEYWARVRQRTEHVPSCMHMILPEADLGTEREAAATAAINATMEQYLNDGIFVAYPNAYLYVERTLSGGRVRRGLVGMVDLETYDYTPGSGSAIRATEGTVAERLPPRIRVRKDAPVELPHIMLLADDHADVLLGPIAAQKGTLRKVYDFELMEEGGHIAGYLVDGETADAFSKRLSEYSAHVGEKYPDLSGKPMIFAVGDGNHSLATAKECYESYKAAHPADAASHPSRYALVELENIHDPALEFEPIHRVITHTDPKALLQALEKNACAEGGYPVRWQMGQESGTVLLDRSKSQLAIGVLQRFLDEYLKDHKGEVDYIHDDDVLVSLASEPEAIGFLLPPMEKSQLFRGVIADGVLPRKTFSMGHAREKRYYLEGRKIR